MLLLCLLVLECWTIVIGEIAEEGFRKDSIVCPTAFGTTRELCLVYCRDGHPGLAMLDHTRFVYWFTILFSTLGYAIHIWIIPIGLTFRSGFNLDLLRLDG